MGVYGVATWTMRCLMQLRLVDGRVCLYGIDGAWSTAGSTLVEEEDQDSRRLFRKCDPSPRSLVPWSLLLPLTDYTRESRAASGVAC